jgi:hypothetical protein
MMDILNHRWKKGHVMKFRNCKKNIEFSKKENESMPIRNKTNQKWFSLKKNEAIAQKNSGLEENLHFLNQSPPKSFLINQPSQTFVGLPNRSVTWCQC